MRDPFYQTQPLYWEDQEDGLVFAGGSFTSGNAAEAAPSDVPWSSCPADLYSFLGVELDPGVPCARVEGGTTGEIGGRVRVDGAKALVGTWSTVLGAWEYQCVTADPSFAVSAPLPPAKYVDRTWLVVAAADAGCAAFQGWDSSAALVIGP